MVEMALPCNESVMLKDSKMLMFLLSRIVSLLKRNEETLRATRPEKSMTFYDEHICLGPQHVVELIV